jgi:single-stranded DNA-binding protein
MTDLNSILIEGTVDGNPAGADMEEGEFTRATFFIVNKRILKRGASPETSETRFHILTEGTMAKVCLDYLKPGRRVRVVGSIESGTGGAYIHAEHVEFRPTAKKEERCGS